MADQRLGGVGSEAERDTLHMTSTTPTQSDIATEGYFWQTVSSHLAVGHSEHFYPSVDGRQLGAEKNHLF